MINQSSDNKKWIASTTTNYPAETVLLTGSRKREREKTKKTVRVGSRQFWMQWMCNVTNRYRVKKRDIIRRGRFGCCGCSEQLDLSIVEY